MRFLFVLCLCVSVSACSSGQRDKDLTAPGDGIAEQVGGDSVATEVDASDATGELGTADTSGETVVEPPQRLLKFRAIGGMSMGAGALNFHSHHPGRVDVVAALGGYVNYSYVIDMLHRQVFGGFCPRELLLAHIDELNDPESPNLRCGLAEPQFPWEYAQSFNHIHPDYSAGTWDRDAYFGAIEALTTAFGNLFSYNPEHPLLPPGVPVDRLEDPESPTLCDTPAIVGKPYNYNAEYNPDGTYPLVSFCDGEEPIPGGEENPDYWSLLGSYDPTLPHTRPIHMLLAVDYNGNGLRDFHEPLVINARERHQDTGVDGCRSADEDGKGGCTGGGIGTDPNGDDFDTFDNPLGTEGDNFHQPGEPYEDFGLDGVDGTGDFGEGDKEYSVSPHLDKLFNGTGMHWIANAADDEIAATDLFLDAGIRDGLQSLTGTYRIASLVRSREPNTKIFEEFSGMPGSVFPSDEPIPLNTVYEGMDWSEKGTGKNFLVMYGYPDATPEQIEAGDGKHVGSPEQVFNRVAMFLYAALGRWPDLDSTECKGSMGRIFPGSFYSKSLGSRFGYSVSLPPCYDESDLDYPVIYFLPGQGMWAADITVMNLVFNASMYSGDLPKFIEVAPEGQCCRIHKSTGKRYCACLKDEADGNVWSCVEPQCKGPHESCGLVKIPKSDMVQECPGGCVFANQVSDRFGNVESAAHMKYEDMLLDLMNHVDQTYRARKPQEAPGGPTPFSVMTFNAGTSSQSIHDKDEEEGEGDGYTSVQADYIDEFLGNSLAWKPAEAAVTKWLSEKKPDIVAFQEMMFDPWCEEAPPPPEGMDLVCEGYSPGGPYTVERLLGPDYQVASTLDQEDNWVGIRKEIGRFKGCPEEGPCIGGVFGLGLPDECNGRPRVSSIEVELADGREFVLVNVHATSGMTEQDMECRSLQFDQVFKDRGDGKPAAYGKVNLVMGDMNTDPFLLAGADPSADQWNQYVGEGKTFHYISSSDASGPATHVTTMHIDHVVSDAIIGSCIVPGESFDIPPVMQTTFFDHRPVLCDVKW